MKRIIRLLPFVMLIAIGSNAFGMSFPPGTGLRGLPEMDGPIEDELPLIKIFWRNDSGKAFEYLFVDRNGKGTLPSQPLIKQILSQYGDDVRWTILGTVSRDFLDDWQRRIYPDPPPGPPLPPNPAPIPLPASAYLFGSALLGLSALGRRLRSRSKTID